MSPSTRASLLGLLEDLGIKTETHEHPIVLTVEEQAKYVGHLEGGHSKNLLLKGKKNRLVLISALTSTNIDLKVLSQRLGFGKGGLRMAPEDVMQSVLQVPLGCVTPFALINQSARSVALVLDNGFLSKSQLFFHPLSNDATIAISPSDLDKFLSTIGRQPAYVDLEEQVAVGKDQPPDLASLLPPDGLLEGILHEQNTVHSKVKYSQLNLEPNSKSTGKPGAEKANEKANFQIEQKSEGRASVSDVRRLLTLILDEMTSVVSAKVTMDLVEDRGKGVGNIVAESICSHVAPELESLLITFKNTVYTEGFVAGIASQSLRR